MGQQFYDVLKSYIENQRPLISDVQGRIDYGVAAGQLTPEQAAELLVLAQSVGVIVSRDDAITALGERVARLEAFHEDGSLPEGVTQWVPPTGAHDAYAIGARVLYDGVVYESLIAANTTVPGSDPRWWKAVT